MDKHSAQGWRGEVEGRGGDWWCWWGWRVDMCECEDVSAAEEVIAFGQCHSCVTVLGADGVMSVPSFSLLPPNKEADGAHEV